MRWEVLGIAAALFLVTAVLGFVAARWRRGDLTLLHEWGLGGRRFGTVVTWFLLGGDLYTAYTFLAVPALVFAAGAIGFFAVPYAVMAFLLLFAAYPRFWRIASARGCVTAADVVASRFGDRGLELAVALTGVLATMPYMALQLVGLQTVIAATGLPTTGVLGELPLLAAFLVLAVFTYTSGIRAPALIAVLKDTLIYVTVFAALVVVPYKLGGYGAVFDAVPPAKLLLAPAGPATLGGLSGYASLAVGSALALFLYPHSMTGVLSASSEAAIRRNAALLPAYTLLLAGLALMGYMALAVGVDRMPEYADLFKSYGPSAAVPALFLAEFPDWFSGIAFAAIGIGALVPAAIMSIAAANLFVRNIWRPRHAAREAGLAKVVSLLVKVGALAFIVLVPPRYAIELQLLGGIWITQTFPAVICGLFVPWLRPRALLLGLVAGVGVGTWMVWTLDFKASVFALHLGGVSVPLYVAVIAVGINLALSFGLSGMARVARA